MKYDSTKDTLLHIKRVNELLLRVIKDLTWRAICHDNSKLRDPEKSLFDEFTPLLAGCTYGSDEYKTFIDSLQPALAHHYLHNSHHPEHYKNGVNGMDLLDLIEMLMDWRAATERHNDGDIFKSIEINQKRFNISPQLSNIFVNTILNMGLMNQPKEGAPELSYEELDNQITELRVRLGIPTSQEVNERLKD